METMTVTRALTTLKNLDKRINKTIVNGCFVTYKVGDKAERCSASADFQSAMDLITYRDKVKKAIMKSNSVNTIQIGKTVYTIQEAIDAKNSIDYRKTLLQELRNQARNVIDTVEDINEDVQRRLDRHIESILGSDSKNKDNEVEQISKAFLKRNNAEVIDEIDIVKKIETMENEIDEFENEIDLCLSEKNSQTYIEV